jgi:N-acetylmuramoyl-L-alanine amidase
LFAVVSQAGERLSEYHTKNYLPMKPITITRLHKISREQLCADIDVPKNRLKFKTLPDTIILHYTAGASAESSATWLANPDVKASAHVVIGKDGELYQLVPFDTVAWHAGPSAYKNRTGFNQFSIGIELDNPGFLRPEGSDFIASFGGRYPADQAIKAVHRNESEPRYWHTYTDAQLETCHALCKALMEKYPIKQILGHEEICPGVKTDPGPAFPLDDFRNELLGNEHPWDASQYRPPFTEGIVKQNNLPVREGPGPEFDTVDNSLPLNKKVTITGELNGWYCVKTMVEGWVSSRCIKENPTLI